MRILTWNINGLRANKTPLKKLLDSFCCEIICIQETKVSREYLDEQTAIVEGYNSYFSFSKVRLGYSGVATFVKDESAPWLAEDGLSNIGKKADDTTSIGSYGDLSEFTTEELTCLDSEGRCIMTEHEIVDVSGQEKRLVIINVYCPRADLDNKERSSFKLRFYKLLQIRTEAILATGRHVIIVGDINTSHKAIDHCEPAEEVEFQSNPGRQWMNSFIFDPKVKLNDPLVDSNRENKKEIVDVLRLFHPNTLNLFTNWCSTTGARATNYGTRLDYIFANRKLSLDIKIFSDCHICPEVMGSDHCPVVADLSCVAMSSPKCPPLCTKYMPQFAGKQQKLSSFFSGKNQVTKFDEIKTEENCTLKEMVNSSPNNSQPKSCTTKRSLNTNSSLEVQAKRSKVEMKPLSSNSITSYFVKTGKPTVQSHFQNDTEMNYQDDVSSSEISTSHASPGGLYSQRSDSNMDVFSVNQDEVFGQLMTNESRILQKQSWGNLLKGPPEAPLCKGHREPCVLRTVKKPGPNKGRQFWLCDRPEGHRSNGEARCDNFVWINKINKNKCS